MRHTALAPAAVLLALCLSCTQTEPDRRPAQAADGGAGSPSAVEPASADAQDPRSRQGVSPGPGSSEDVLLVCEWTVLQARMESEAVAGLTLATEKVASVDTDDGATTQSLAQFESAMREVRRQCQRGAASLEAMRTDFRTPVALRSIDLVATAFRRAEQGAVGFVKILEEVDGNSYRFAARESDLTAAVETIVDATSSVKKLDDEKALVVAAAKRILGQTAPVQAN